MNGTIHRKEGPILTIRSRQRKEVPGDGLVQLVMQILLDLGGKIHKGVISQHLADLFGAEWLGGEKTQCSVVVEAAR